LFSPRTALSRVPGRAFARIPACALLLAALAAPVHADLTAAQIQGDSVPQALTATPGDASRGRALLVARENANCILCHGIPEVRFSGNLAPPLDGVGARLSAAQMRLRVADNAKVNPQTIMPSYYRSEGFTGVAAQYRGKTVLTAQEVEDVIAYLQTLK
jgi:sulfur-oxidizing protein SoxX